MTREEFQALSKEWHRDTGGMSSIQGKLNHSAYKEIMKAGKETIPFILEELSTTGGHWFIALGELTGVNPIRDTKGLTLAEWPTWDECVNAWVEWGKKEGYIGNR